jgi:lipoate-protein ligase A
MRGDYKTPGGKLVSVSFDIVDQHIRNVQVSGDFFLYPEEALDDIREALEGLHTQSSRDAIARGIDSSLAAGVSLVGFSSEAVAIAVERGLGHDAA